MELTIVPIYICAVYSAYTLNLAVMLQKQSKTFLTFMVGHHWVTFSSQWFLC